MKNSEVNSGKQRIEALHIWMTEAAKHGVALKGTKSLAPFEVVAMVFKQHDQSLRELVEEKQA